MADEDRVEELEKRIQAIENQLSKYKGFVGGIVFVVSGLVTFITLAIEFLKK